MISSKFEGLDLVLGQYRGARDDFEVDEVSPIKGKTRREVVNLTEREPITDRDPLYPNFRAAALHDPGYDPLPDGEYIG